MLASLGRDRAQWLVVAALIAAVNGMATAIIGTVAARGVPMAVIALGGVNPIIWFTLFAACSIAFEDSPDDPLRAADRWIVGIVVTMALVPVVAVGSIAVTLGGGYLWWTSPRNSRGHRAAIVLLALTTTLLWGRLILLGVGNPLLALDGQFVAALAGTSANGNLVELADGKGPIVIGYACSSMHNMTYAILLWAAFTQLLRIPVGYASIAICAVAMIGNLLVNGVRLAVIAHNRAAFDYWHSGAGGSLFGWGGVTMVALVVGIGCYAIAPRRV